MDILAVTRHLDLVEALRTAFERTGHRVEVVEDQLQALATEAWNRAHLLLVDADGDPFNGYRLCGLLRGESRMLFRNLPIFLVLDHPAREVDQERLEEVDGDGFLEAGMSARRLAHLLGPLLEGTSLRNGGLPVPVLATGLDSPTVRRIREAVAHYGFELHTSPARTLAACLATQRPPLLFLGVDPSGERALAVLRAIQEPVPAPYTILVGKRVNEATQRRLLAAGAMDWLGRPISAPMLLHICRRALEWAHLRRLREEYHRQLGDMAERRALLEKEAMVLRSEVVTDALTELLNRRAFTQHLEHAIHRWERHQRAFVLILGDLDYFKLINDRFGHMAGDEVLKAVGQRIRSTLRRSDLAFRIGGEEFAVLLSETSFKAGIEVAEKIRQRIESTPLKLSTGPMVFPTMSFGVGIPGNLNANDLFIKVDEALYQAKHKGRNRVETTQD
jgi:diguanylate cyclase (GGDEF)-like protein